MKTPDQSAVEWKMRPAIAGPSTRIGSAATVTAATMSSKTMILGSSRAIRKPFMTRERLGAWWDFCGRNRTKTTMNRKYDTAFSKNAQPNPTVLKISTLISGASARPRL